MSTRCTRTSSRRRRHRVRRKGTTGRRSSTGTRSGCATLKACETSRGSSPIRAGSTRARSRRRRDRPRCAGRQKPCWRPAAVGIRRRGRDPRRSSKGRLRRRLAEIEDDIDPARGIGDAVRPRRPTPNATSWFENSLAPLAWVVVIDEQRPHQSGPSRSDPRGSSGDSPDR